METFSFLGGGASAGIFLILMVGQALKMQRIFICCSCDSIMLFVVHPPVLKAIHAIISKFGYQYDVYPVC